MKNRSLILTIFLTLVIGCSRLPEEFDWSDYKGTYVGNNSAVGAILNELPAHEYLEEFSLKTDQPPYEMTIRYKNFQQTEAEIDKEEARVVSAKTDLKGNAILLFALIENVDCIHFNLQNQEETSFNREELTEEFGDLESIVQDESSMQQLFKAIE